MQYFMTFDSPIGKLFLSSDGEAVTGLYMDVPNSPLAGSAGSSRQAVPSPLAAAAVQLAEYFAGERRAFALPLSLAGTPFQREVWRALTEIPYGETVSYGELARRIGNPRGQRAVGLANNRNPVSIIVPCHRVIGADGSMTGYGGGLERKRWLLAHEGMPQTKDGFESRATWHPKEIPNAAAKA
jgi:methylated-DNA-[protein]-cysteine S-methyltransferase